MVIAHLQEEEKVCPVSMLQNDPVPSRCEMLRTSCASSDIVNCVRTLCRRGGTQPNLGILLLTFLMRYGIAFAYNAHALSVGQGGVIPRASLTHPIPSGQLVQLVVEDVDTKRWAPAQHMLCIGSRS